MQFFFEFAQGVLVTQFCQADLCLARNRIETHPGSTHGQQSWDHAATTYRRPAQDASEELSLFQFPDEYMPFLFRLCIQTSFNCALICAILCESRAKHQKKEAEQNCYSS